MSKVKKTGLIHYEMLFIVPNKYTEDEVAKIVDKVRKIIKENGGNITFSEDWGKKKFAYEINHYNHGYYSLFEFDLASESLAKIDRALRMSNEVLRHQIVKKRIKTAEDIKQDEKIAEKIAKKTEAKDKEEKDEARAKDKSKLELKDLDDKLDKILDTDDLL